MEFNDDNDGNSGGNTGESVDVEYKSNINSGYHGSVIDTGSSTLSMPRKPSQDIMNGILKLVHTKVDKNTNKFEWTKDITKNYDFFLQWNGKKTISPEEWKIFKNEYMKYFPDIIMLWMGMENEDKNNALKFRIPVDRYLLYKKPHLCLDLFGDTPSILVGSNVMVNKFMIYDREAMKLGVADINCDSLLMLENKQEENNQEDIVENVDNLQNQENNEENGDKEGDEEQQGENQENPQEIPPDNNEEQVPSTNEDNDEKTTAKPTEKILTLSPSKAPTISIKQNDIPPLTERKSGDQFGGKGRVIVNGGNGNDQGPKRGSKLEQDQPTIIIQPGPKLGDYMKYIIGIIVFILIIYGIYYIYNRNNKKGNNRKDIQYQRVSKIDPDEEEMANENSRHKQHNYRRKRLENNATATSSSASLNNMNNINVNMDMLSMTTPTQSFTSKQYNNHDAI